MWWPVPALLVFGVERVAAGLRWMSAMWAGGAYMSPPAPATAVLASARLVSMLSREDTIPTRKPTTTRTTRTPIVTHVHIQPVSAPAAAAFRGADAAAVALVQLPSVSTVRRGWPVRP